MNFFKKVAKVANAAADIIDALNAEPAMLAVLANDVDALTHAYAEGERVDCTDNEGNNLLHIACRQKARGVVRAVLVLTGDLQLWKNRNHDFKLPGDLANEEIKSDLKVFQDEHDCKVTGMDWQKNCALVKEKIDLEEVGNEKVLMSLDGGGMRGLVEIQMILYIERQVGAPLVDLVDWVAGTSTGSILAIALGQGRSVEWAHQLYIKMAAVAFTRNDQLVPRYNAKPLEDTLKENIGKDSLAKLKTAKVLVTASRIDTLPPQLVLLRSYTPLVPSSVYMAEGFMAPEKTPAWTAARCSCAAPTYFASYNGLADGAMCTNNPAAVLLADFNRVKKIERLHGVENDAVVHCMISLGTGQEPKPKKEDLQGHCDVDLKSFSPVSIFDTIKKSSNLINMFVMQCISSDGTAVEYAREWSHSLGAPYYRFTPPFDKKVALDETRSSVLLDAMWQAEVYVRTRVPQQMNQLISLLKALHEKRKERRSSRTNSLESVR